MRCIWTSVSTAGSSRTVSLSSEAATHSKLLTGRCLQRRHFSKNAPKKENDNTEKYAALASSFVYNMIRDTSVAPTPHRVHSKLDPEKRRNAARLSRVAAQSVRIGCKTDNIKEPMIIIKALRGSLDQYPIENGSTEQPALRNVAIDFGQAVSPRLAVHALLHGLLRSGKTKKAGELARTYMGSDIPIHRQTLHLITKKLCETDTEGLRGETFRRQLVKARKTFKIPSSKFLKSALKAQAPCTNLAVDLFFEARQYQRKRAKQMFQQLVDACLLQGEILVLTFLFAFLIIRWQYRKAGIAAEVIDELVHEGNEPRMITKKYEGFLRAWFNPHVLSPENERWLRDEKLPSPSESFVNRIMTLINAAIFNTPFPSNRTIVPNFEEAAQALAILASMLEDGILPLNRSAAIISALTSFPATPAVNVWSLRKGEVLSYPARQYFDQVLDRLIEKIGSASPEELFDHESTLRSCNSLLHYALHRKLSPSKGSKIFNTMLKTGGAITPNIVSFNILLQSAIQLRRDDFAQKVLDVLRQKPENYEHAIIYEPNLVQTTPSISEHGQGDLQANAEKAQNTHREGSEEEGVQVPDTNTANESSAIRKCAKIPGKLPSTVTEIFDIDFNAVSDNEICANNDTLTLYLGYLTSTGKPEVVKELIYFLIPELEDMDKPTPRKELDKVRSLRTTAMRRAIALGPFFFTAVLNALQKAGLTTTAEQVWLLAKRAEKCSWLPQYAEVSAPWVLPIAAYTTMMQCYCREARKSLRFSTSAGAKAGLLPVHGWARFVRENAKRKERRKFVGGIEAAHGMGSIVFRAMQSSGRIILDNLDNNAEKTGKFPVESGLEFPIPDERFFNAALDLFGRIPASFIRQPLFTKEEWQNLNMAEQEHYFETGKARLPQDPVLTDIVRSMHTHGYEVPLAFRRFLIGFRTAPLSVTAQHRKRHPASPYGVWNSKDTPYSHSTSKSRGLPLQRRQWKGIISNHSKSTKRANTAEI